MSKEASKSQEKTMSRIYRGKEIFKPLNTGRIDERVSCVREFVANIFFYTKNGVTIMIDAGYNYDRLEEKMGWLDLAPGSSAEENYTLFRDGLVKSRLFHMAMGNADDYLTEKKLPGRLQWAEESKKRQYENDWVVDVLPGGEAFDLGYDYLECGACKLCRDEGCYELAQYLCRLDFVLADMMGMELERTTTIAEGGERCDFRYRRKKYSV